MTTRSRFLPLGFAVLLGVAACDVEEATDTTAVAVTRIGNPPSVLDPPWLEQRRQEQFATAEGDNPYHGFRFTDRVAESGITFRNRVVDDAAQTWLPIHYDHGNGVAAADVDGDSRLDLYFTNQVGANQLWRNLGGGRFEDVTDAASVGMSAAVSVAAAFADIDSDGDPDLYVTAVRDGNVLFRNDGGGRFTDISAAAGVDYQGHSSAAVFFDYDLDGNLDLYLTNIGIYTSDQQAAVTAYSWDTDRGSYSFPDGLTKAFDGHLMPERDEASILYRNTGNCRFVDITRKVGLVDSTWSGAASPLDVNEDGWPDLYVLNMQGHDEYYENDGGQRFVRRSREVFPRTPWGSMGIKVFDFDNDGGMDVYVTDMHSDMSENIGPEDEKLKSRIQYEESFLRSRGLSIFGNAFYHRTAAGDYEEISDLIGAETYWPWGLSVGDLNADGYEDVFVSAGMNYPWRYGVNSVLLNDRGREFLDSEFILGVEPRTGRTARPWFELDCAGVDADHMDCAEGMGRVEVWGALGSRSSVILDIDDDGDMDIVTNDFHSEPMVLVSDLAQGVRDLRYLQVSLRGTRSNRDGLGARITLYAGGVRQTRVHDGQSGYLGQSSVPLYFGLGGVATVDSLVVDWPSRRHQVVAGPVQLNTRVEVVEP